jgi:hypothetical protein
LLTGLVLIGRSSNATSKARIAVGRQLQIARNPFDRLTVGMLAQNPNHCLRHQHPDLATRKIRKLPKPPE